MNPESSPSPKWTETTFLTTTDGVILAVSTPSGGYIAKSFEPMSLISILPEISSSGFVEVRLKEWSPTPLLPNPATSGESLSPSWTGLLRKYSLVILISLSLWGILLFGLYAGGRGFLSFVVLLPLALTVLAVISYYLLIIRLLSCGNGPTDPPSSST